MTNSQTQAIPLAVQALRIMDADGEAAMMGFIENTAAQDYIDRANDPPKTAKLSDGSMVHLINGTYIFDYYPVTTISHENTRIASPHTNYLPDAFKVPVPLLMWPNQETLHSTVLELLEETENEGSTQPHTTPNPPNQTIEEARESLKKAVQACSPTLDFTSPTVIDHLGSYMDDLAHDIIVSLPPGTRQVLLNHLCASEPTDQYEATSAK